MRSRTIRTVGFPARRLASTALVSLAGLVLLSAGDASAHPVAQGALDLEVSSAAITVRARVSTEEAFVAGAFAPGVAISSPAKLWDEHGRYVLDHLRVFADGHRLVGRILAVLPPGSGAAGLSGAADRVAYDLEYRLAASSGAKPAMLRLEQDLLNEIEFAPGNRWEATFLVRIVERGGPTTEGLLLTSREPLDYRCEGGSGDGPGAVRLDRGRLVRDYLRHGVMHILTGYDHLLFIAALVLATVTLWDLVKIVSAFTLAHTITLTFAVLDIVRVPGWIVEPMIAASIVFVAVENLLRPDRSRGAGRTVVAFFFGLFHGLGFAGGLLEVMAGMSGPAVGLAILAFSAGVELGHQVIIVPVFGLLRLAGRTRADEEGRARVYATVLRYGSVIISVAGVIYLIAALR